MNFIDFVNLFALAGKLLFFLANVVGLQLILWASAANWRTVFGRMFLAGILFVLLWMDADFLSSHASVLFSSSAAAVAAGGFRAVYVLMAVFFAAFYVFALNFPGANPLDAGRRRKSNFALALWAFLGIASFMPLVVREAVIGGAIPVAAWIVPGQLFWLYVVAAAVSLALSFLELSRNRRFADAQNRQKIGPVALSAGTFGIFNLIFNIIAPALGEFWGYVGFFAMPANYVITILLGYVVYRAVHDKLFGIKIILVEVFVGLMGASLLALPIFLELLWQRALMLVLFVLFCIFGYVLVQSTVKELREKEELELKVAQRTRELERAKMNLEELNAVLEIRVRARTRELELLNQTLEEKIVARTNDLESKIKDLETFQKITVGRELKMIELKEENARLRAQISNPGQNNHQNNG